MLEVEEATYGDAFMKAAFFLKKKGIWSPLKVALLHDKSEYIIHIRNSKRALNHRLVLKKSL